jgi:hypothetical protein
MKRLAVILGLQLLAIGTASAADTPEFRLKHALTLKCSFTASATTEFKDGQRTISSAKDEGQSTFSVINIQKGAAKVTGNNRAADVVVRYAQGEIWFIETTPAGNLVITTVFPLYVQGTEEFVVVESRHSVIGTSVLGEQSSGGCKSINDASR